MRVIQAMAGARFGGAETFFERLVLALNRAGVTQRAAIRRHPERAARLEAGGVEVLQLPFRRPLDLITVSSLKQMVAQFRPEVVITWMRRASAMFPPGDFLRVGRLDGYYDLKSFRRCDHLFCVAPGIFEHVVARGWPRERAHYLPNFATPEIAPALDRGPLATPADAPLLLALGRLHEAKAFDILLRALAVERRAYLWLAGEGPLRARLEALAGELGVAGRARFLGWRRDLAALFAAADICVFPSRYEPFGIVSLEAWAYRRPLVAAAAAGPQGLIEHDKDGLLVPVDDPDALAAAITRVIDEPGLAERLVAAGAGRYEAEFTETACVQRHLVKLDRLLGSRRGTALGRAL